MAAKLPLTLERAPLIRVPLAPPQCFSHIKGCVCLYVFVYVCAETRLGLFDLHQ